MENVFVTNENKEVNDEEDIIFCLFSTCCNAIIIMMVMIGHCLVYKRMDIIMTNILIIDVDNDDDNKNDCFIKTMIIVFFLFISLMNLYCCYSYSYSLRHAAVIVLLCVGSYRDLSSCLLLVVDDDEV